MKNGSSSTFARLGFLVCGVFWAACEASGGGPGAGSPDGSEGEPAHDASVADTGGSGEGNEAADGGGAEGSPDDAGDPGSEGDDLAEGDAGHDSGGDGGADTAEPDTCTPECGPLGECVEGQCVCDQGAELGPEGCVEIDLCADVVCSGGRECNAATGACECPATSLVQGAGCWPLSPDDPAARTEATVCAMWSAGNALTDAAPWSGADLSCEPGELSEAGRMDTLNRLSMFRWMSGFPPSGEDAERSIAAMECAVLSAYGPPAPNRNPHEPSADQQCYTALGAESAGVSNLSWGAQHPAQSITNFMDDWDNPQTMGHRRWCLHPQLSTVGIGYYKGGGPYGDGMCLDLESAFGAPPVSAPAWYAFPPPGYAPTAVTSWIWTFHSLAPVVGATVTMRSATGEVAIEILPLFQGYGHPALAWRPKGFTPVPGEAYTVRVEGGAVGLVEYTVIPTACQDLATP